MPTYLPNLPALHLAALDLAYLFACHALSRTSHLAPRTSQPSIVRSSRLRHAISSWQLFTLESPPPAPTQLTTIRIHLEAQSDIGLSSVPLPHLGHPPAASSATRPPRPPSLRPAHLHLHGSGLFAYLGCIVAWPDHLARRNSSPGFARLCHVPACAACLHESISESSPPPPFSDRGVWTGCRPDYCIPLARRLFISLVSYACTPASPVQSEPRQEDPRICTGTYLRRHDPPHVHKRSPYLNGPWSAGHGWALDKLRG